jgi:very-short-patch-repair endonuclease
MKRKADLPMFYGAVPQLFHYAQEMRKNPTQAEKVLWDILSDVPFVEYRFRRQHPIGKFIADFYSHRLRLVIEVDGGYHREKEQKEFDSFRDEDMKEFEISVLRFSNDEVLNKCSGFIESIVKYIQVSYPQTP